MSLSRFFIDRPIVAWVMALIISIAGVLSISRLPISQYPVIAPPAVTISAVYPGAAARTAEESVTQIIEQAMTGLDGLLYMSSTSDSYGGVNVTLTFASGTDPDIAQVQAQNKLQLITPLLPGIVQQYGLGNLLISTAMAGVLLFVMGLTRIGSLIRYIPVAIVIGFTNGIAVLIALSQVKELLGLQIEKMPADFFGATRAIASAIDTVSVPTLVLGLACIAVIVLWTALGHMMPTVLPEAKVPGRYGLITRLP